MKKQFIALVIIIMLIASVHLFAASDETSSVTDTVSTVTDDPSGIVVSLGLSHNDGVIFSLAGPKYSAANPGAPALASGGGTGITYGFGARLQYTLFDAGTSGEKFQIDAALADPQTNENLIDISGDLSVGISAISNVNPKTYGAEGRTSGDIGDRSGGGTDTSNGDYDGVTFTNSSSDSNYPPGVLSMIQLTADDTGPNSVALIVDIEPEDTWTGTGNDDGAQLFYELLSSDVTVEVVYTLKATSI